MPVLVGHGCLEGGQNSNRGPALGGNRSFSDVDTQPDCNSDGRPLMAYLHRQLARIASGADANCAQRLIEAWISEALDGTFRAIQEILIRIDGRTVHRKSTSGSVRSLPQINELMARKLFEAARDRCDDPPND
jgi:hypothetical protein